MYKLLFILGLLFVPVTAYATYELPDLCEIYPDWEYCYEEPLDVCSNLEGYQETVPEGYVNEQGNCYIPEEPTDHCPTLEGVQGIDEDCPKEEEPPVVPPVVVEEPKKDVCDLPDMKIRVSQGPGGHEGDGMFQAEWDTIPGVSKVQLKLTHNGNTVKKFTTKDDGTHTFKNLTKDSYQVKIRAKDGNCKGDWSEKKTVRP